MKPVFNYLVALLSALALSSHYASSLRIVACERRRYFLKSSHLALCYVGLRTSPSFQQAKLAGKAAFLCCAYDVVTDWRAFDRRDFEIYRGILVEESPIELAGLAIDLYHKECAGALLEDGLERGAIALRFVTGLMRSENLFSSKAETEAAGRLLQLVDDLLDYERDLETGELNCLASVHRPIYLQMAEELEAAWFQRVVARDPILARVIRQALCKARSLLSLERYRDTRAYGL